MLQISILLIILVFIVAKVTYFCFDKLSNVFAKLDTNKNTLISDTEDTETQAIETANYNNYSLPSIDLLEKSTHKKVDNSHYVDIIKNILSKLKIEVYEIKINTSILVTKIDIKSELIEQDSTYKNIIKHLEYELGSNNIEYKKSTGIKTFSIIIPNQNGERTVNLSNIYHETKKELPLFLGLESESNKVIIKDIVDTNHILISGSTGSGKSVCLLSMIQSLILSKTPDELKLILIDYKGTELPLFENIPHLAAPIITDTNKALLSLEWVTEEVKRRYKLIAKNKVTNIKEYNEIVKKSDSLPYFVIVIDEIANLTSTCKKEFNRVLQEISSMSRASGIYLILSTQRPDRTVIDGVIKANLTTKIAFKVESGYNSRIILDSYGAEKLLGKGDALARINEVEGLTRLQVANTTKNDIMKIVDSIKTQNYERNYNKSLEKFLLQ